MCLININVGTTYSDNIKQTNLKTIFFIKSRLIFYYSNTYKK